MFAVTNTRGGQLTFGAVSGTEFAPTELLLAAAQPLTLSCWLPSG
jgi:hypothetical protein